MDEIINNEIINNLNRNSTQSSCFVNKINNDSIEEIDHEKEENLKDILFVSGNETNLGIYDDENTLMELVWWLFKPPIVPQQLPTVSARRIQATKERISSTIKKSPGLAETLQDKIEENLKKGIK